MRTILVLMDSLNRHKLKIYNNNSEVHTPNIDKFSKECMIFDNHFIGSAPCMPARRDIFTGRMNFLERNWGGIEPFDVTLPNVLRNNSIFTHIVTDHTHYFELGGENYVQMFNTWDYQRGQEFDTWISKVTQPNIADKNRYGKAHPQYELNRSKFKREEDFPTPRTFKSACGWIEENKEEDDFFLMVEAFDPHEPFDCPKEYLEIYENEYIGPEFNWSSYDTVTEPESAVKHLNNTYSATLTMADKWFGKFINTLKENNMFDDTLIIFTTDHGHLLGEHGWTGKNVMHVYNELAHIPLMIHLPNSRHKGKRISAITQNIDLMPTILEFCSVSIPKSVKGYSLLPLMNKEKDKIRNAALYGWFGRAVNIYDGKYTYFRAPKDVDNKPCYNYCCIPTSLWTYLGTENPKAIDMGRFLPYIDYPVYKIPANDKAIMGSVEPVLENLLFDIETDYEQLKPLHDEEVERYMKKLLIEEMEYAQSPKEQYERLGLNN